MLSGLLLTFPAAGQFFEYTYEGQSIYYDAIEYGKTAKTMEGNSEYSFNYVYGDLILPAHPVNEQEDIEYSLTEIGKYSFISTYGLNSLELPNTLETIREYAFFKCSSLKTIQFGTSVREIEPFAFAFCDDLAYLEFPNSVKTIGTSAFTDCEWIRSIEMPRNVEEIGSSAFANCPYIDEIYYNTSSPISMSDDVFDKSIYNRVILHIPVGCKENYQAVAPWNLFAKVVDDMTENGLVGEFNYTYNGTTITYTIIDEDAKTVMTKPGTMAKGGNNVSGDIELPAHPKNGDVEYTLVEIGDRSFAGCSDMTSVTLPNTLKTIGEWAFHNCVKLAAMDIPNSVETVSDCAFYLCRNMACINIPASVTYLGQSALCGCDALTSVTLPPSITSISESLFYGCDGLVEMEIPTTITSIGSGAFILCSGLTSMVIPASVTSFGSSIFSGCSNLQTVTLPNTIKVIGSRFFNNCRKLEAIEIPTSVEEIEGSAFSGCSMLTTIELPSSVKVVESYAISYCDNLTTLVLSPSLESIDDYAFACNESIEDIFYNTSSPVTADENIFDSSIYSSATLHIPIGTKETFQSVTPWNLFNNIVDDLNPSGDVTEFEYTYEGQTISYTVIDAEAKTVRTKAGDGWTIVNPVTGDLILPSNPMYGDTEYTLIEIGDYSLAGRDYTSVVIPNTVQTIGAHAFKGCSSLTSMVIPNSVKTIEEWAFGSCYDLTSVTLGNSLQSIGIYAFAGCSKLSVIEIPASVELIGEKAFMRCSELTAINVSDSNPVYASLDGIVYNKSITELLHAPGAVEEAIIPESVTTIGVSAFYACRKLNKVDLPNTVTRIEQEGFWSCGLPSIEIPSAVEFIGDEAFAGCLWLKSVYYNTSDPIEADAIVFATVYDKATLYVPEAAIARCKAIDPWKNFETIEAYDFNGIEDTISDCNGAIDFALPYEVYTLSGLHVADAVDNLVSGIYVVRQGVKVQKIAVK